jgi:hypothetical protein
MDKENAVYYTMEYYSAITKNEIMWFAGKWNCFILSEISQTQTNSACVLSYVEPRLKKNKDMKVERGLLGE